MSAITPRSASARGGAGADRGDGRVGERARVAALGGHRLEQQPRRRSGWSGRRARRCAGRRPRRGPRRCSSRGSIRIAGSSTTSAPSARRVAASPLAWARARVTTTRLPCSGRRSSQAIASRRAATGPKSRIAGAREAGLGDRAGQLGEGRGDRSAGPGCVPRSIAAAGSAGSRPAAARRSAITRQVLDPHVEDERAGKARERLPVERRLGLLGVLVAGDEGDRGGVVAVGDRDPGVGGRRDPGGDPGHDLERRPRRRASASASSPPRPNTNGSPPLSRTTLRPAARALDHQRLDLVLLASRRRPGACRRRRARRRRGRRRGRRAGIRRSWRITSAARDQLERARGHQPRVAGPGADQVDDARRAALIRAAAPRPRGSRRAPAVSIRSASASPSAAGCSGSPATRSRTHSRAVRRGRRSRARRSSSPLERARRSRPACRSSPPSAATAARSAVSSISAAAVGDPPRRPRRRSSSPLARLERQAALARRRGHLARARTETRSRPRARAGRARRSARTIPS